MSLHDQPRHRGLDASADGPGLSQSPAEVLEAVQRMESEIDSLRLGARRRDLDLAELGANIAADAARERRLMVEDLERVIELVGASWRSTREELTAAREQLAAVREELASAREELGDLRDFALEIADAFRDARLELRLAPAERVSAPAERNGHLEH